MTALSFADDRIVEDEVRLARAEITCAALNILDGQEPSEANAVVRREYQARLSDDLKDQQAGESAMPGLASIQRRAIAAERRALDELRSRGDIGDDAFHQIEQELDWAEVYVERDSGSVRE
jgi:monovalent cation/hydrogen antiporter